MTPSPQTDPKKILEARAALLARQPSADDQATVVSEAAVVQLGRERLGIPAALLREIVPTPPVAQLPKLPAWLPGIVQLRGELLTVLDLRQWLGIRSTEPTPFLAIVQGSQGSIAIAVEEVLGFTEVREDALDEGHALGGDSGLTLGVTRDLTLLLNVEKILGDSRLLVSQGAAGRGRGK